MTNTNKDGSLSVDNLRDLLRGKVARIHADSAIRAQVQDSNDLPVNKLRVWRTDNRQSAVITAERLRAGVWVYLRYNAAGELYIDARDAATTSDYFEDVGTAMSPLVDGSQTSTLWDANNLKMGAVVPSPTNPGTLKLTVMPIWWNGGYLGAATEIDPTSDLPGSANQFRWLKVGISTLDGSIVTETDTAAEYPTAASMSLDDLRDIALGDGVIPAGGVSLAYGQTDIALSRFVSLLPYGNGVPGYNDVHPRLMLKDATTLTIASGAATPTQAVHFVDTESAASTDDLDTLTAPDPARTVVVYLLPANGGRTVVIRHNGGGTGNIRTFDGASITLDETYKLVRLIYIPSLGYWVAEAAGGGSTSFTLNGDSGSATITSTMTVSGGTGLTSTVSGSTATINLDNTAVTPGSYTNANITVDAQGRITAASNGTGSSGGGTIAGILPGTCQGRLTLTSGTPITTTDVHNATTLYFTPLDGSAIALYNTGTSEWDGYTFAETSLSLSGLVPWSIHDVFAYWNGSAVVLERVAWNAGATGTITGATNATPISATSTAHGRSTDDILTISGVGGNTAANGTFRMTNTGANTFTLQTLAGANVAGNGAYTSGGNWYQANYVGTRATALTTQDGVRVKSGDASRLYLGTFAIGATAGQTSDSAADKLRLVWNNYNPVERTAYLIETTDSWSYAVSAWRAANNNFNNRFTVVCGVVEEIAEAEVRAHSTTAAAGSTVGIGVNTFTSNSAPIYVEAGSAHPLAMARWRGYLSAGLNNIAWIEYRRAGTTTWLGDAGVPTTVQSGMDFKFRA